jgi:hypothetical protein
VGREDDGRAIGHLVQFLDEDRALFLQPVDHETVMDDLVPDIDRGAEFAIARSTISIARSTPAQPRGAAISRRSGADQRWARHLQRQGR